jgi:DNA-binding response OmpR family regulator
MMSTKVPAPFDDSDSASTRGRSAALRARSDAIIEKAGALQARSVALRQRLGRLDWPEVRILNVEDHEPARFLRTRTLENAGYTVDEADSARAAMALAASGPPIRLALLDVGLPDGDGFKVCEQLKLHHPAMQVVMITSIYRSGAARQEGIGLGADEYLLDPLPGHRLVGTLERVLSASPAVREAAVITTDAFGRIVGLNVIAGRLLNISPRAAVSRSLLTFVNSDRGKMARSLDLAAAGQFVQDEIVIRPRERKPLKLEVDLDGAQSDGTVEWTMRPVSEPAA